MCKVSIIVPNYNHGKYLKERIDSILNQTYDDYELILLDDCSTDNSKEILHSYASHPKVSKIIENKENTGNTFLQWQRGIELAKSDYIWIAESDDMANSDFLRTAMDSLTAHPDVVMCLTGSNLIDHESKIISNSNRDKWKETGKVKVFDGNEYIVHNLTFRNMVYNASMVVFKRDVFSKVDKSFQKLKFSGDWQFWINVAIFGKVIEVRKKLNGFRQHNNKVSTRALGGQGMSEDIEVINFLLNNKDIHLNHYIRTIIKGNLYKQIHRTHYDDNTKKMLIEKAKKAGVCNRRSYLLERINKILSFLIPFIKTSRNMKLR